MLADHIAQMQTEKVVVTTKGPSSLSNRNCNAGLAMLQPSSNEEADTRMILPIAQTAMYHKKAMIRTVDTDVVVLAVSAVVNHELEELWVASGTGTHFRYIPAHQIATSLGPFKSNCLTMFHGRHKEGLASVTGIQGHHALLFVPICFPITHYSP